jgi:predicted membrane chloride channel (bestrophin family)
MLLNLVCIFPLVYTVQLAQRVYFLCIVTYYATIHNETSEQFDNSVNDTSRNTPIITTFVTSVKFTTSINDTNSKVATGVTVTSGQ